MFSFSKSSWLSSLSSLPNSSSHSSSSPQSLSSAPPSLSSSPLLSAPPYPRRLGLATDVKAAFFIFWLIFSPLLVSGNEYCLSEHFNASCADDEIIIMTSAVHGRMRSGKCIRMEYDKERCQKDVIRYLDRSCSGRRSCTFVVASLRETAQVCHSDLSTYLEASYRCVKVFSATCFTKQLSNAPNERSNDGKTLREQFLVIPTSEKSFHHHHTRTSSRAGSEICPWQVEVEPRQRIRFTLYNFLPPDIHPSSPRSPSCVASLVFEENSHVTDEKLCRSSAERKWLVFTSSSNSVSVHVKFSLPLDVSGIFLLQYEAIGCGNIKAPAGSFVSYEELSATVRCNRTGETWSLSCEANQWIGDVGNCSDAVTPDAMTRDGMPLLSFSYLPYGLATAVTIGVLLGIIVGSVPLGLAYAFLKRKWQKTSTTLLQSDTYDLQPQKTGREEGISDQSPYPPLFFHRTQQLADQIDCDCFLPHYHHQTYSSSQTEVFQREMNVSNPVKPDFPDIGVHQRMVIPPGQTEVTAKHFCESNKQAQRRSSSPSRKETEKNIHLGLLNKDITGVVYFDVQPTQPNMNAVSANKNRRHPDF